MKKRNERLVQSLLNQAEEQAFYITSNCQKVYMNKKLYYKFIESIVKCCIGLIV